MRSILDRVAPGALEDSCFDLEELSYCKACTLAVLVGGPQIMHVGGFHVEARLLGQRQVPTRTAMVTRDSYSKTPSNAPQNISIACARSGFGSRAGGWTVAYPLLPYDIPPWITWLVSTICTW